MSCTERTGGSCQEPAVLRVAGEARAEWRVAMPHTHTKAALREHEHQEHGDPIRTTAAVHQGRVLKLGQLNQGAMESAQHKVIAFQSSAPTATSETELQGECAATQVPGYTVCPTLTPAQVGNSEHTCGKCA